MKPDFEHILDECIRRIESGEDLNECLADYPEQATELEPLLNLAQNMYTLSTPNGSEAAALAGQQRMLNKFDGAHAHQVLSPKPTLWESGMIILAQISKTFTSIFSKENIMYRKSFIAVALALAFLFAGTTMTAYASQGSLPGDTLFTVNTTLEDFQINSAWNTADEAEKSIQYADCRIHCRSE